MQPIYKKNPFNGEDWGWLQKRKGHLGWISYREEKQHSREEKIGSLDFKMLVHLINSELLSLQFIKMRLLYNKVVEDKIVRDYIVPC